MYSEKQISFFRGFLTLFFAYCLLSYPFAAFASPDQEKVLEILDRWTSFRWGDNNLTWVIHYPDEVVEPLVREEGKRQKMTTEQLERYRKTFKEDLKIDVATPIMVSVHAFGKTPLRLNPVAQSIVLIDSTGKRVFPFVFEKKLDAPLNGLVQGLVFFPKQKDNHFHIAIKSLRNDKETVFSFDEISSVQSGEINTRNNDLITTQKPTSPPTKEKEVIVKIPTRPQKNLEEPKKPDDDKKEAEFDIDAEVFEPTTPPSPLQSEDIVQNTGSADYASDRPPIASPTSQPKLGARQVLDIYLKAWLDGDSDRMYALLSKESQEKISQELFRREVLSGGFRQALKGGYKVTWSNKYTAKITVAKKVLFMRTMDSKNIIFVEEDGSARVSW